MMILFCKCLLVFDLKKFATKRMHIPTSLATVDQLSAIHPKKTTQSRMTLCSDETMTSS